MKFLTGVFIFTCLAFPVFSQNSQNSSQDRFQALSESMGRTISSSQSKLEYYDQESRDTTSMKTFTFYRKKHEDLSRSLRDSEAKLDLLLRTNDRADTVKKERDFYEGLINELQSAKSDYDSWLKSAK